MSRVVFTRDQAAKLNLLQHEIREKNGIVPKAERAPKINKNLEEMKSGLRLLGIDFTTEHRFHEVRKFRFDIAIVAHKIGIEYEGLVFNSNRSKSTGESWHTNVKGYSNNCEKYNLALCCGWRVLRYTALNYKKMICDVEMLMRLK